MIPPIIEKKAAREIVQGIVIPFVAGLAFFAWFYHFIKSPAPKILVFPTGGIILVFLYFFAGAIHAGILLACLSIIGISSIFLTGSMVSRLVFPLETAWLLGLFMVLEYYRNSYLNQRNRVQVEMEVLDTKITMLSSRIEENGRHAENLSQRIANYQSLGHMAQALGSVMEEEELFPLVGELAGKFIGKGAWRIKKGFQNDVFAAYVRRTRVPLLVSNLARDTRFSFRTPRFMSLVAVPIEVGDRSWGILKGVSPEPDVFDESDLWSLSVLAGVASLAINNAHLYRKTQALAITDGLTGLYVQSYFRERLAEEIMRSRSHSLALSIAIIDVDHFKSVNDTYGHAMGDVILRQIAALLRGRLRETDFVSRYGGEEFGVIMPQTDAKESIRVVEEIRKSTREERFFLPVESFHPVQVTVTISIGVASAGEHACGGEELLRMADKALYRAKNGGRDQVVHY